MKTLPPMLATVALAAGLGIAFAAKDEPKPTAPLARTWDAAVEDAKTLVVPIVVHSHDFY